MKPKLKTLLFAAGLSAVLAGIVLWPVRKEVKPIRWYDFDGDGVQDALVATEMNTRNPATWKANASAAHQSVTNGVIPHWISYQGLYTLGFISGKDIQRKGTNYSTRAKTKPLEVRVDSFGRSDFGVVGIGDSDKNGFIDVLLDGYEVGTYPWNTPYKVTISSPQSP